MENPASVSDVVARFPGTMTDVQLGQVQALLDDAWEEVVARVPGVESRLDSGALRVGIVIAVLRQAVIPVLQNAEGFLEESIDDWTGRRDSATSSGKVLFTVDDLAALFAFESSSQAYEIVLGC